MKPSVPCDISKPALVAPRRGAWIETAKCDILLLTATSHPAGVRGLKLNEVQKNEVERERRTPCGCVG